MCISIDCYDFNDIRFCFPSPQTNVNQITKKVRNVYFINSKDQLYCLKL